MDLERFIRSKLDQFKNTVSQGLGNVGGAINQGVQNFNKPIQKTTPINWVQVGQKTQYKFGSPEAITPVIQNPFPNNPLAKFAGQVALGNVGPTLKNQSIPIPFTPFSTPKFDINPLQAAGNLIGFQTPQKQAEAQNYAKVQATPTKQLTPNQLAFAKKYSDANLVNAGMGFIGSIGGPKAAGFANAEGKFTSLLDKKTKFQIPDNQAYLKVNSIKKAIQDGVTRLSTIFTHDKLYKNYPEFKNLKVVFDPRVPEGTQGLFDPQTFSITVNPKASGLRSTLLHEVQHAIQTVEGFATGTNLQQSGANAYKRMAGEIESRAVQARQGLNAKQLMRSDPYAGQGVKLPDVITKFDNGVSASSGVKERGLVTSVGEAPTVASGVKSKVSGTYIPKPNEKLMGEAKALLNDGASIDFKNTQGLDKKVAATIQEAINLQKQGNHEAAANLYNNLSEHATELGRGVQAFSLLDKMSPEAVSLTVAGKIRRYNATHSAKIPELTGEQTKIIADKVAALDGLANGSREKNIALNELNKTINSFIPSSITDKAIAVWKAGLLTSFRTHERNFLGNLIHGTAEVAKDPFAVVADKVMSLKTGERTKTFTLQGLGEFGSKNTRQQMADIITKGYDPSQQVDKFDYRAVNWGNNRVEQTLKKYTDLVFNTLGASDKPFYNAAMARSLYDQAGAAAINAGKKGDKVFIESIVKNPPEEILKRAIADANVATFKNKNVATSVASAVKRALANEKNGELAAQAGNIVGEVIMPFTGVPSSILGQAAAYSPIGLTRGIINAGRVLASDVPNLQREAAHEIGRGVVGTGIFGLGAYLAGKGLITGQPKDAAEARQWELENKPRNSILINGQWKSLNSIGPESIVLLAGAKFNEDMNNPEKGFGGFAGDVGKDVLDQSFLTGIQQPVNAITDPVRYGKSYVGNLLSSPIPNLVKDLGKSQDPYQREANSITDYAKSNIPLVRNTMLPRRDALGNPIPQEPTGVNAFIDPFNTKTPVNNPVVNELSRLNSVGANATPGKIAGTQTIGGIKTKLTPEQLDTFESSVGSQAMVALAELFKTEKYQSMTDEEKSSAIDSLMAKIRKQIREGTQIPTKAVSTKKTTPKVSTKSKKPKTLKAKKVGKVKVSKIKAAKAPKVKFSKVKAPKFKIYKPTKGKFAYSK